MKSSINNGGSTHIKYGHFHYPRVIEIKCPKCESKGLATNKDASIDVDHFMDIANFEKIWNTKCLTCNFRSVCTWSETKNFELWLKIEIKGIIFWAWNTDHLKMLIKKLNKENTSLDKWEIFANYIPKEWFSKINKAKDIGKIKKLLAK